MTADNHIHTKFSPDGNGDPEEFVQQALALGCRHMVFTEHVDLHYYKPEVSKGDVDGYFACVRKLQKKYADELYIGAGLEMGYTTRNKEDNKAFIAQYRPDYVINSVHQVGDSDCYFPEYFTDKTPHEAYASYLDAVRESLDAPYPYHAVGHIGYVCRNAPFDARLCPEFLPQVADILRCILRKNKILELNTNCRKEWLGTLPERNILLTYAALGGRKLCFSSDAHRPRDIGRSYETAKRLAAAVGVKNQTVIEYGKESTIPF